MPEYELNLRDYIRIFRKRRFIMIFSFLATLIISVVYANSRAPIYQAAATIKISGQFSEKYELAVPGISSQPPMQILTSQAQVIESQQLIEEAARKINLISKEATKNATNAAVASISSNLQVEILSQSSMIKITVKNTDPKKAALIANTIADIYIAMARKEITYQATLVSKFIESRLNEVSSKLSHAEEDLQKISEKMDTYKRERLIETKKKQKENLPVVTLKNKLQANETKLMELVLTYTEVHPTVIALKNEIAALKEQLSKMQKESEVQDEETILNIAIPGEMLQEETRLKREITNNEKVYDTLKNKLDDAKITEESNKAQTASIVDTASEPRNPINKNLPLNTGLGAIMGAVCAFIAAFIAEQLDASVSTIEEVEKFIGLPVIGLIPYLELPETAKKPLWKKFFRFYEDLKNKNSDAHHSMDQRILLRYPEKSHYKEAYRILHTNIFLKKPLDKSKNGKGRSLMITSSSPIEGKTLNCINLAITIAQMGQTVVLVDCDLRKPYVHKAFGFKNSNPGLTEILTGTTPWEDTLRNLVDILMGKTDWDKTLMTMGLDNLSIITSGSRTSNATELINSPEMDKLIDALKSKFDVVLIDTPPVLTMADTLVLAPKVDEVIIIHKLGKISREMFFRTKTQLENSKAKLSGVILNVFRASSDYYYKYYQYSKYYSEEETT